MLNWVLERNKIPGIGGFPGTSYLIVDNVLTLDIDECEMETFRKHERTGGRPLGNVNFIEKMKVPMDRKLKPQKPDPKK
jgi:hypothetical protein